ncbi:MAG TPA: pseudouridine synthase [Candidatus Paceibacterota bacterium]|nr:pseudouridine synthase [Candidatus Paceibacterota bacterium]
MSDYPMRINKYLAHQKYCTRREADSLIESGKVFINGRKAVLGDKVVEDDAVEVRMKPRKFRYVAYHKPAGIITHSAQGDEEEEIADISGLEGLFPVGRLDKDSHGLIILTNDGRLTEALLNPEHEHEKEYEVKTLHDLPEDFQYKMEHGVDIGDYVTKPCTLTIRGPRAFSIVLTEGKKHQIRRMCGAFGQSAIELKRTRIMNVRLGKLAANSFRNIEGAELKEFLGALGLSDKQN